MTLAAAALVFCPAAAAQEPTPGYPEAVVQWGVQKRETCEDIAKAMYGSAQHVPLLLRYNRIACTRGAPLREGLTLVLPARVTTVPTARLRSVHPQVKARMPGAGWSVAGAGQPLTTNSSVNTLTEGRADIEFIDRTRVFLASNTLVVIYGTASQTSVSKTPPPAVEVEAGEVAAGIAALRGDSVEIAVPGGGRVSASSRDAVVQRKGERTTVAVFDGKAAVKAGGKTVDVPTNFGTRFVAATPPVPPRPLPPAPAWESGGPLRVILAPGGQGVIRASWAAVPKAKAYRFEVSRDDAFRDLVVREEIPATVRSFRAERMPPGTYSLRVRAIDEEEYLGIASPVAPVEVVAVTLKEMHGRVDEQIIEVNPYAIMELAPSPRAEIALDEGPFGPIPPSIDLHRRSPQKLRLRARGAEAAREVTVRYTQVRAAITAEPAPGGKDLAVKVQFEGLSGIDVPARVAPRIRVHWPEGVATAPLAARGGVYTAMVPMRGSFEDLRMDVLDSRGGVIGSATLPEAKALPLAPAPPREVPIPRIGVASPAWQLSPHTNVLWWSPTTPDAVVLSATADAVNDGGWGLQGQALATGGFGPFGLEALIRSNAVGDGRTADSSAWFGGRWRAFRIGAAEIEGGAALRLGVPVSSDAPPEQFEPALALGGVVFKRTWLVTLGARIRLRDAEDRTAVDPGQIFLLAGGTYDLTSWLRAHAVLDGHLYFTEGDDSVAGGGGLGVGLEAGDPFFGAISARMSPWREADGLFAAQISVGVRAP